MPVIYLDNNATTEPDLQVLQAMQEAYADGWANASSLHRLGQQARYRLELARREVATLIAAQDQEIVFTSGGTESNNLALRGVLMDPAISPDVRRVLVIGSLEHPAIAQPMADLSVRGIETFHVGHNEQGEIDPASAVEKIHRCVTQNNPGEQPQVVMVSIQWANNETGVIQPIGQIMQAIRQAASRWPNIQRLVLHSDATQAVGKIPVNVAESGLDMLTFSGHKFHGPKGVGGLWVRRGERLRPQNLGGPQEQTRRGGTENVPAIVGMGVACRLAQAFLQDGSAIERLAARRDRLESLVRAGWPNLAIASGQARHRLWNTTNLMFDRLEAEAILIGLSEKGVGASAGSACSSGSLEPSSVLTGMRIPLRLAHGAIRFSLSKNTTDQEIEQAAAVILQVVQKLTKLLPLGTA